MSSGNASRSQGRRGPKGTNDMLHPVRAVIFDVYHTLLSVGPGPEDAAEQWVALWQENFGPAPSLSLLDFDEACRVVVGQDHARRLLDGVAWPEVDWPSVAVGAAADLAGLSPEKLDLFLSSHAKLQRRTHAMPGAAAFLTKIRASGILTGIASNAQRYTFAELTAAGIPPDSFAPDLCFWSFEHGFSKPDPAVFAPLTKKLAAWGIAPPETLMIGDRPDNDISPARAAGWQTWLFEGSWPDLGT